jgi:hypothetical protein
MKVSISVTSREEGNMILAGLADPETFALVKIMGVLSALSSRSAKERALRFARDRLWEEDEAQAAEAAGKHNGGEPAR